MNKTFHLISLFINFGICYLLDPIPRWLGQISRQKKDSREILVVRTDALGDFVLWLDAAKGFRQFYPSNQYKITLLVFKEWVELAQQFDCWDQIIPIELQS